jgi:hypothetical protein
MLTAHHNAQFEVLGKLSAREQADLAQQVAIDFADHASRVSIGHSRYRPGADGQSGTYPAGNQIVDAFHSSNGT